MFKAFAGYYSDGYKIGHPAMLAPGTSRLYGTWIPRSLKHAPKGVKKILSAGHQLAVRWLHDEWTENFFNQPFEAAESFGKDMSMYLGMEYNAQHFYDLHKLGYLPLRVKALPEGIETDPNIPHMTFINTVDGFGWFTLFNETILSSLAWKPSTSATIALQYRRKAVEWVMKTDPANAWLIPFMCHDFSARGLSPWDMLASGLGHAMSFRGSDTLVVIPAARYFYNEPMNEVCINSVNASEHSVSTTKIFTVGEQQMIADWLQIFPKGILSIVSDTFDLWKLITEYLPANKEAIMARDGKLVIRPDSGDPVDIICGKLDPVHYLTDKQEFDEFFSSIEEYEDEILCWKDKYYTVNGVEEFIREYGSESFYDSLSINNFKELVNGHRIGILIPTKKPVIGSINETKGVIELLWDIFGGTINDQGYKVLDPHIGAIYGDSITLDRQIEIYERLAAKGFAATNIVLGIGSFTYQYNTRDTFGFLKQNMIASPAIA
jgi:nicotinamide phosphoribosyltransferase